MFCQTNKLRKLLEQGEVPCVSIAATNPNGAILPIGLDIASDGSKFNDSATSNKVFCAASLSKPVFAYLVLKLINANQSSEALEHCQFKLPKGLTQFDLDTPLYKILPGLSAGKDKFKVQALTARQVLSHKTGIPNSQGNGPPEFTFEPGKGYGYAGFPYLYLQMVMEKLTGSTLEELAKKYIFDPLHMDQSTFLREGFGIQPVDSSSETDPKIFPIDTNKLPSISANSLRTTAGDYARFVHAWINDETLQNAFNCEVSMTQDKWAKDLGLPQHLLNHISWGLGWGLQKNDEGKVISAFHWGDMGDDKQDWRSFVALNLENKTGVVYFSNAQNGLLLANEITSPHANVGAALHFIQQKLGFQTSYEPGWQESQLKRFDQIKEYLESCQSVGGLLHFFRNQRFFKTLEKEYLIDNRHNSDELQHAYDKRFGLSLRK